MTFRVLLPCAERKPSENCFAIPSANLPQPGARTAKIFGGGG